MREATGPVVLAQVTDNSVSLPLTSIHFQLFLTSSNCTFESFRYFIWLLFIFCRNTTPCDLLHHLVTRFTAAR